ncbi:Lpg1974 family pore-forming outer membrane protein [Gimesia alba]|uniref:Lpg1974 family pore-forming outer membrane protein n=1 Tax=Gimesia alba TaxID=2527973 RepID=UPI001E4D09B2|nr:Lpg1974 family pore-forming outer membrane protein [Gimesia alba]
MRDTTQAALLWTPGMNQGGREGSGKMFLKHWYILAMVALVLVAQANIGRAEESTASSLPPAPAVSEDLPAEIPFETAGTNNWVPADANLDLTLRIGVPDLRPGWQIDVGALFLKPSSENLGYAVLTTYKNPGAPEPLASPYWEIESVTTSYQPGFEVGSTYTYQNTGRDFQLDWQHLRTSNHSGASAQSGTQWVSPFSQTGPGSADTYDDLEDNDGVNKLRRAEGVAKYAYDAVNLDFGQHIDFGSSLDLRLFAGLSFARLQESVKSSFYGDPPEPAAVYPASVPLILSLDNTSTFSGVGPRFGVDSLYQTQGGLRFTGQIGAALLVGRTEPSQYVFGAVAEDLALIGISYNQQQVTSGGFTQVVYSADAKLGIGFEHIFSGGNSFSIDAGYQASVYADPFAGYATNHNVLPIQIGSLSTASVRQTNSNFTLHGFYVNLTLQW